MEYLTWDLYQKNAEKSLKYSGADSHWRHYKQRWLYHKRAIEIIKSSDTTDPSKILEMGTMGASLVIGSDTIDYDEKYDFPGKEPTYSHDARQLPWPVVDKKYEWFIALRVFQHLYPVQKECFMEALRVADKVLIVVPDDYPHEEIGKGITLHQFLEWNNGKPPVIVECTTIKRPGTHLYCWGEKVQMINKHHLIETKLHTAFPKNSNFAHTLIFYLDRFVCQLKKLKRLRNL